MLSCCKHIQVGACIVTTGESPVLLGLGYNGMPDGPGFKDSEMDWRKPLKHHTGNVFSICEFIIIVNKFLK